MAYQRHNHSIRWIVALFIAGAILLWFSPVAWGAFGFTPAHALNSNAIPDKRMDNGPDVATDGAGTWMAVWESNNDLTGGSATDTDIHVSVSTDNGATWSAVHALNNDAATDERQEEFPKVATDANGHWIAVWGSTRVIGSVVEFDVMEAHSSDDGATWSNSVSLDTDPNRTAHWPTIASDRDGHWIVVWDSFLPGGTDSMGDCDIYAVKSSDDGATWSAPLIVNTSGTADTGNDQWADVASDTAGNWVVVWQTGDDLGGTIGDDYDILVARSSDNGATWTTPAPLNANAESDTYYDEWPRIAAGETGIWVAVWDTSADSVDDWEADVYAATSTDDGVTWSDPVALNSHPDSDSSSDSSASIATNRSGDWMVVWESWRAFDGALGKDTDLLVTTSNDNGATWATAQPLKANAPVKDGDDSAPQLATDENGNWVVVWNSEDKLGQALHNDEDILVTNAHYPQPIEVRIPNGGETWKRGDSKKIKWRTYPDPNGQVRIDLLLNGSLSRAIKKATPNDGALKWEVPQSVTPGGGYSIRIQHKVYPEDGDESDGTFTIK